MKYVILASLALGGAAAAAPPFPPDTAYVPFECGFQPMTDLTGDDPTFVDDLDIVGDHGSPAGLRAADDQNLYLRLRFDKDPAPGGTIAPAQWGIEIDLDGDATTYELLILVDGIAGAVEVFTNHIVTLPNAPDDPADTPAASVASFANAGRTVVAGGVASGGDPDAFLDFAVPWTVLQPLGLDHATPIYVWAASSSSPNGLNGDFACHDGASGLPRLGAIASDLTVADPTVDTDGDGFTDAEEISAGSDPRDPNSTPGRRLEGGGGCSTGGGSPGVLLLLLLWGRCHIRQPRPRRTSRT